MRRFAIVRSLPIPFNYLLIGSLLSFSLIALGQIFNQYDFYGYLTSQTGIFDDLIIPTINVVTYQTQILTPVILAIPDFNSPFSPITFFFYFLAGKVFEIYDLLFKIQSESELNSIAFFLVLSYVILYMSTLRLLVREVFGTKFTSVYTLITVLSPYLLFAVSRGNIVILLVSVFNLSLILILRGKEKSATTLLALLACFQFPYLIFSLLILALKRPLKCFLIYFAVIALAWLTPLALIGPGLSANFNAFLVLNDRWYQTYVLGHEGILHGISLLGVQKTILFMLNFEIGSIYSLYFIQVLTLLIAVCYFVRRNIIHIFIKAQKQNHSLLPIITLIATIMLLIFPQVSAAYKMLFFTSALLFLGRPRIELLISSFLGKLLLVGSVMLFATPHWNLKEYEPGITADSILKPIFLLGFLILTISLMRNSKFLLGLPIESRNLAGKKSLKD